MHKMVYIELPRIFTYKYSFSLHLFCLLGNLAAGIAEFVFQLFFFKCMLLCNENPSNLYIQPLIVSLSLCPKKLRICVTLLAMPTKRYRANFTILRN